MLDLYALFELAELRAIHAALEPSLDSIFRKRCREYSVMFHTPLHQVYTLDPLMILQTLQEEKYNPSIVEEETQELLDILYRMRDPGYSRMSEEETENLVDAVIMKEMARLAKKKPPTLEAIKEEVKAAETKPRSGGMDFSELEKIDSEGESGQSGFKD